MNIQESVLSNKPIKRPKWDVFYDLLDSNDFGIVLVEVGSISCNYMVNLTIEDLTADDWIIQDNNT